MKIDLFSCGGKWVRSYVTSPKEPVGIAQCVSNVEDRQKAIVSGGDGDSGDLSLPFTSKVSKQKRQTN